MNIAQAEDNLKDLVKNFSKDTFIFDLMKAYEFPKATISKMQKGNLDKSKSDDEVILKGKFFYKTIKTKDLKSLFEKAKKEKEILKNNPRFILYTDFKNLLGFDVKNGDSLDVEIKDLAKYADFFLPWVGVEKKHFQGESPADVKAAEKLAKVFDLIKIDNPSDDQKSRHAMNVFLTRVLFCFFAEDTGIFDKRIFTESIASHTQEDGSDLPDYLKKLFKVLNEKNRKNIPAYLDLFPYVNGGLFAEEFIVPKFSKKSRNALVELGDLNWAEINPDIFGSMIQAVVHPDQRAGLGMHYTSVPNIMKVIQPLFLDELNVEFSKSTNEPKKLYKLLSRLEEIRIFDPACGSGNFLIIAYKELRLFEIKILRKLLELQKMLLDDDQQSFIPKSQKSLAEAFQMNMFSRIQLSSFYGIEIDDFAHESAKLSLWLAEHQMNSIFKNEFGVMSPSLPLKIGGNIVCSNGTRVNWEKVCPKVGEVYILGNPPYVGARYQSASQKLDVQDLLSEFAGTNDLDYIGCWFYLASVYIKGHNAKFAFVTTNSIIQGEQVSILWPHILNMNLEIFFAHQSFKWTNMAKNNAVVTCAIVGLRNPSKGKKYIFSKGSVREVENISPYLTNNENIIVFKKNKPISNVPKLVFGNQAIDGGFLILSDSEKKLIIETDKRASKFIRRLYSAEDYIDGIIRWCIWVSEDNLKDAIKIKEFEKRFSLVKNYRTSAGEVARSLVNIPYRFRYIHEAKESILVVPRTTSERRMYIPIGFLDANCIVTDAAQVIYDPDIYIFAILSSRMHLSWVKTVAGRLKTDFRYSNQICYNSFPFPDISSEQKNDLEKLVYSLIACRELYSDKTLGELYDPDKMPKNLLAVHEQIDSCVDLLYSNDGFKNDDERLEHLFNIYKNKSEEVEDE